MKKILAVLSVFSFLFLFSCSSATLENSGDGLSCQLFAMNTVMDLWIGTDNEQALEQAQNLIHELDNSLSVTYDGSEIYKLNEEKSAVMSSAALDIISEALKISAETDGALDITVYPVLSAWGFTKGKYRVPSPAEISSLLEKVDYNRVKVDGNAVTIGENQEIDLGALAKGYTSRAVIDLLKKEGVESALVTLGGNVETLGRKKDGTPFRIAVQSPLCDNERIGVIEINEDRMSVITSGGYQRNFTENAVTYHHIINPEDGCPADSGLISVTVICPDALRGDGLSTALYVMGIDKALSFYESEGGFEAVLVTDERKVYITPGLAGSFSEYENTSGFEYIYVE